MKRFYFVASWVLMAAAVTQAAHWPHWRGPAFNGSSEETGLPAKWSKTENLAWTLDLPGPSAATPIIWNSHVFISSTDRRDRALVALAVDRNTGRVLWRHKVADGLSRDDRSNYAAASPVTDGKVVVFFYGNGPLAAYDFDGRQLWQRNLCAEFGDFAFLWTFATSPTLMDGRLIIQVLQRDVPVSGRGRGGAPIESYLLALDPHTGKTLWQHTRPSQAVAESREAFTTPIPFEHNGRKELLVVGGDCLTGHAPDTGEELWRWGTWNPGKIGHWRLVPSPVSGGGVILVCAPKREPIFAIRGGGQGNLAFTDTAWASDRQGPLTSDVPTPLFYQGDFFVLSDLRKSLSRIDPATGRIKWTVQTPGTAKFEASPTGADGKVYLMNFRADAVVVDAAKGEVLEVIPMGEPGDDMTRSSIAVSQGRLFIRTNGKLYCVGR
jgi:outer membrane protein assembly factor BamB